MKILSWNIVRAALFAGAALALTGCGSTRYPADTWKLPERQNQQSAMIFGRIELPSNKQENPDGDVLLLNDVNFQRPGHAYFHAGHIPRGEDNYVMDNKFFVIPDIPPGKYMFAGFTTGNVYNGLPLDEKNLIEVKPGQLLFIGSYDYLDGSMSRVKMAFGLPGSYGLRANKSPTELEMLQWLSRAAAGSGWEAAINKRIRELGGRPQAKVSAAMDGKAPR